MLVSRSYVGCSQLYCSRTSASFAASVHSRYSQSAAWWRHDSTYGSSPRGIVRVGHDWCTMRGISSDADVLRCAWLPCRERRAAFRRISRRRAPTSTPAAVSTSAASTSTPPNTTSALRRPPPCRGFVGEPDEARRTRWASAEAVPMARSAPILPAFC